VIAGAASFAALGLPPVAGIAFGLAAGVGGAWVLGDGDADA